MILVTGLMRSGTSPLAQMLHQMGCPMGVFQRFPTFGPASHFEWEDAALAEPLLLSLLDSEPRSQESLIRGYILQRQVKYQQVAKHTDGMAPTWGVKTPFVLPYLSLWREVASDLNEDVVTVLTERPYADTLKSLETQLAGHKPGVRRRIYRFLKGLQQRLAAEREKAVGEVFQIEETWKFPHHVAQRLGSLIGFQPNLETSISGIGRVQAWA